MGPLNTYSNKKNTPFSIKITTCSKFDPNNTAAFANYAPIEDISVTPGAIFFSGFSDDYVLLSIMALDKSGNAAIQSYELHFGDIDMPILVLAPDGQPASNVPVYANATICPGLGQECTTDASGKCTLTNLPSTTISLVAKGSSNSIAVGGLASTSTQVAIQLLSFTAPTGGSSFDTGNGTTGWSAGTVSPSAKVKRDTSLVLSTGVQSDVQRTHNSFAVRPFTKVVYIKYRFVTSEVPGGYFGTQFNDYYSITIRSDTGAFVTVTNSMNALGLGAFDAYGATQWYTLSVKVPTNTKSVRYDISVSNVADSLLDSSIEVDKVGDLQCDKCGDCSTCQSDPMCQSTCLNPQRGSCDFYRNCAEGQLNCGVSGYPLAYGERFCNRYLANMKALSPQGVKWMYDVMYCLQTSLVPILKPCKATCDSFKQDAFASHPACYVKNGFCSPGCGDVLAILMTVYPGLDSLEGLKQVV